MVLAKAASRGLGMPNLPVAPVPGHPGLQSKEALERNISEVTLAGVVDNLLKPPAQVAADGEPGAREIICSGTFEEVNEYFIAHELSDGLPIVPPTVEKVEAFLHFTDRKPDAVRLGRTRVTRCLHEISRENVASQWR